MFGICNSYIRVLNHQGTSEDMGPGRTEQVLEILEMRGGAWYIFINSKQSGTLKFQKLWNERNFCKINIEIWLIP